MSGSTYIEKRQFGRRESTIHAVALIGGRAPAYCIVRNFSERGALLEFNEYIVPPFRFRLVVEAKGVDVMCEVRHQGKYGVGVYFVSGSADGLFDIQAHGAKSHSATPPPVVRTSGLELRTALFGVGPKQPVPVSVRSCNADAGGIIRAS